MGAMRTVPRGLCLVGLVALTVMAHSRAFSAPFVFDDLFALPEMLEAPAIGLWPYRVAEWIGGGLPWAFHGLIVLLHLLNGALFWIVARRWMTETAAGVALTLFWLHPLPAQAVAYVIGGREVLLTTYVLIAAIGILSRSWVGAAVAVSSLILALTLKTSALALAIVAPVLWASLYGYGRLAALVGVIAVGASVPWAFSTDALHAWGLALWRYLLFIPIPVGFSVTHDWIATPPVIATICVALTAAVSLKAWQTSPMTWWAVAWIVGLTLPRVFVSGAPPLTEVQTYLPFLPLWLVIGTGADYLKDSTWLKRLHSMPLRLHSPSPIPAR